VRADNVTIGYHKKQIDVRLLFMGLSCYWQLIWSQHYESTVVCRSTRLSPHGSTATLTMSWLKFVINNRTDTWKTDVNLLILQFSQNWISKWFGNSQLNIISFRPCTITWNLNAEMEFLELKFILFWISWRPTELLQICRPLTSVPWTQ